MSTLELLSRLRSLGITLTADGGQMRLKAPPGALTPELRNELIAQKDRILGLLNDARSAGRPQPKAITRTVKGECSPLSFAQERLWFLEQLQPGTFTYNIPGIWRLQGRLDATALEQSLGEIVRRHQILRTAFSVAGGEPRQKICPWEPFKLSTLDLRPLPEDQREAEVRRLASLDAHQAFDLGRSPLIRATLLGLAEEKKVLLINAHHIAFDGWSARIFTRELELVYEAFRSGKPSPLPELPIQYVDFAGWQREWLQGEVLQSQLAYWKTKLNGHLQVLDLPTDKPRPAVQTPNSGTESTVLPRPLFEALKALSRREGVTLFTTMLAAFKTCLHRYTGQEDILVGTPIANRNRAEIEGLVGFFVNTLVLRSDLSGKPAFRQLLSRVREVVLEAHAHQDLPFEKLVQALKPERSTSHLPLFQVMFDLLNTPAPVLGLPGLEPSQLHYHNGGAKVDVSLRIEDTTDGATVSCLYSTDLFEAETIRRMLGHYQTLLEGVVSNPDQRVSDLPLLTSAERHQLLMEWNRTEVHYPKDRCVHELIEEQVGRTPEATAVIFEDKQLTYRQLNERANQLARYLQGLGVGPDTLVGICVERSLDMVVGLLGILKAGGAYVPLDPSYPKERLEFMLEEARPVALVTQRKLQGVLPPHRARLVCLDASHETDAEIEHRPGAESKSRPDCLAYVLYTSGSTGRPKGVAIEHRSAVAFATWARRVFTDEEFAGVLFSTSICFDLSVFELFVTLANGGKVILAESALELPTLPAANEVRMINTVPSAMAELVRANGIPRSVITVNLAGEPLAQSLVDKLYEDCSVQRVYDLYGPTEATTYSTFTLRQRGGKATIGRPISNTHIYLLDRRLQPVPIGVPGELHIGGIGLARGYHNRPELTAEKFILDPFRSEAGARLYKTGDLARYLPDGAIEYLGRLDHQVKIRGFRIELGEIESVLAGHPAVREAVVVAREDVPGDKRLVAYLTAKDGLSPTDPELRDLLQAKVPQYMVPSAFVTLDQFPLTPNGKVDRKALPPPDHARATTGFVPPRTPTEVALAKIWCELLGLTQAGLHDNFFELGGHSLLATRAALRAGATFQVDLPLRTLFEHPTLASLAGQIDTLLWAREQNHEATPRSTAVLVEGKI